MSFNKFPIKDRVFFEVKGGYYDDDEFYLTPNGSFWDPEGNYFNRHGFDINGITKFKLGGSYNENGDYVAGVFDNLDDEDDYYFQEENKILQGDEKFLDNGYDDGFDEEEIYSRIDLKQEIKSAVKIEEKKPEIKKEEPKKQISEGKFDIKTNIEIPKTDNTKNAGLKGLFAKKKENNVIKK